MALTELEHKRCEKLLGSYVEKHRPPVDLRKQVDLAFRITGQSIEIFEVRQNWKQPELYIEQPVIKATYVQKTRTWKIYWMRADLKWHRYAPDPEVKHVEDVLALVERDEYGCFFG